MTKPTAEQLSSLVQPITRQYIDAKVEEELRPVWAAIKHLGEAIEEMGKGAIHTTETIAARLSKLEARYAEDDKFALTKARIADFIERSGIK